MLIILMENKQVPESFLSEKAEKDEMSLSLSKIAFNVLYSLRNNFF